MWWFTKKNQDVEPTETESAYPVSEIQNEDRVPIPREKFILESNVVDDHSELPIYGIYERFQEDWETKGYKNAIEFPETSYRDNQKRVIVDKLRLAIKEALLRYDDKLTDIDSHINRAEKNGLVETLEKYQQERKKLIAHRDELAVLDQDVREVGEKTRPILVSYDMGFTRGLVALSDDKVKEIMKR